MLIVLNKFNMRIPANAKVALVGASGCGKSTITNLILRFYDVLTGHIQIDGVDIRNYNVMALRKQIGFVMQEPVLFDLSIKENILYGNRDAKDSDVYRCAELANALAFIESDIEKRDKASKMKKYKSLLRRALRKCKAKGYPSIAKEIIPDDIAEQGQGNIEILLKVLQMSDSKALELIERDPTKLTTQIADDLKTIVGLRWDDLIIRFEWNQNEKEINNLLASNKQHSVSVQASIES